MKILYTHHGFHKDIKQHNFDNNISEWFLKDCVTLKSEDWSNDAENSGYIYI